MSKRGLGLDLEDERTRTTAEKFIRDLLVKGLKHHEEERRLWFDSGAELSVAEELAIQKFTGLIREKVLRQVGDSLDWQNFGGYRVRARRPAGGRPSPEPPCSQIGDASSVR